MKKIICTISIMSLTLFYSSNSKAQITLDATIDSANLIYFFNTVQISSTETKYYIADTVNNVFNLYNMDFTPFLLGVAVPEPYMKYGGPTAIFRVIYISRSLFDCDTSNIEYAYEEATHSWESFYIMRTDGTQLFKLDSANAPYCFGDCLGGSDWVKPIVSTSSGTKLFLQRYWGGGSIYSLCGTLPETYDFINENMPQSFVKVFPNPTSGSLTFEIHPPNNSDEFEFVIIDNNAKELEREKVKLWNNRLTIDMKDYASGTYFYSLCTKNKSFQNGKFILNN